MENNVLKIVVADDEKLNLEILEKIMADSGYEVVGFEDGDTALEYIQNNPNNVDIIILDKMMPRLSGFEVLKRIKADSLLKHIPVILQTGDVGIEQLKEGLQAGAYYYLSKPFYGDMLVSLVNAAARDCVRRNQVLEQLKLEKPVTIFLKAGVFEVKTPADAYRLSAAFSCHSSRPDEVNLALSELLLNAIEHGNLGISYDEKNNLLRNNKFDEEIEKRLELPDNMNKTVKVKFERVGNEIVVVIEDHGNGFDWKKYLSYDPIRLTDLNGRGIASANLMRVGIEFIGCGNKVKCKFESQ